MKARVTIIGACVIPYVAAAALPSPAVHGVVARGLPQPVPYQYSPPPYGIPQSSTSATWTSSDVPRYSTSAENRGYPTSSSPIWYGTPSSSWTSPAIYSLSTSSWASIPMYSSEPGASTVVFTLTSTEIVTLKPSTIGTSEPPVYSTSSAVESKVYNTSTPVVSPPVYSTSSPAVYSVSTTMYSVSVYSSIVNTSVPIYGSSVLSYSSIESVPMYSTPASYNNPVTSATVPIYSSSAPVTSEMRSYSTSAETTIPSYTPPTSTCVDQPMSTTHYMVALPWAPYSTEICHTFPAVTCSTKSPLPYSSTAPIYISPTSESTTTLPIYQTIPPETASATPLTSSTLPLTTSLPSLEPPASTGLESRTAQPYSSSVPLSSEAHLTTITDRFPTQFPPSTTSFPANSFSIISVIPLPSSSPIMTDAVSDPLISPTLTSGSAAAYTSVGVSVPAYSTSAVPTAVPTYPARHGWGGRYHGGKGWGWWTPRWGWGHGQH